MVSLPVKKTVKSACSYCGVGCGVEVSLDARGHLAVRGDDDHPVNRGMLCSKGRYLHQVAMDTDDRLLYPEMRLSRAHPRERVSWDTAIHRTAAVFRALIRRFGPESVGFYVSGQFLTEEYYTANKLMKGFIGCNNIDTNSRLCMSSAVAGYKMALGDDAVPISYEDIERTDCFFIAGANPAWCHPILYRRIEKRKQSAPNTKIVVVDPRRTESCALADLHLQIRPGADVALYNAIARIIVERGWHDREFIRDHVDGFDALCAQLFECSVPEAAKVCGVTPDAIETAAEWLGASGSFLTLWAMGLNQSANGVDKNLSLLNLSLITGQIGKPGSGPFSLTGQPNAMGGREAGGLANLLAAHRDLGSEADRAYVANFWGVEGIRAEPGRTATEMFDALESGAMKAVWIMCTNPAVSMPNLARIESALEKARFVVVQDISKRSDSVRFADVVFPAAGWLEKQGTMTNSERRVTYLPKLIDPPGEALPDSEILCRFAAAMGWGHAFTYADASEIFDEHCRLTRGTAIDMSGMNYGRLQREGSLQWPCPDVAHPGTPRLFADGIFLTPNRRAQLHATPYRAPAEAVSEAFPLVLTTGRVRDQWHTMTRTGNVARLRQHEAHPFVEIHPHDAQRFGITNCARIVVENARGSVTAAARVTDTIRPGVVFIPMHWSRALGGNSARVNALTSSRVDPISKEPDFKFSAVRVRAAHTGRKRVVIAGAGAAALEFVRAYRRWNSDDELIVLGKEPYGFYNRTLLPGLIAGTCTWPEMATSDDALLTELNVTYRSGVLVSAIDRIRKIVLTHEREEFRYDRLVLATGSRPNVPRGVPRSLEGVHTLRSRSDADRIRSALVPDARAVILGGGLLGVELADALNARGVACTIVHRSPVLMGTTIDAAAGEILKETLEERGVRVLLNERILQVAGRERVRAVGTHSGHYLECDLLAVAAGVTPCTELAERAGLKVRHGVVVNPFLVTSDPSICAIGEIAEFEGATCGTTAAAQEQARAAAAAVAGGAPNPYRGSTPLNVLKIRGLELCSAGNLATPGPAYESIVLSDIASRYYKRCVVHRNRLVGALLVGDISELATYRNWIEDQLELDDMRSRILRSGGDGHAMEPPKGRLVCSCHNVGEENLRDAIRDGCNDLDTLCARSRAGTGCGSCRSEVDAVLRRSARAVVPAAAL